MAQKVTTACIRPGVIGLFALMVACSPSQANPTGDASPPDDATLADVLGDTVSPSPTDGAGANGDGNLASSEGSTPSDGSSVGNDAGTHGGDGGISDGSVADSTALDASTDAPVLCFGSANNVTPAELEAGSTTILACPLDASECQGLVYMANLADVPVSATNPWVSCETNQTDCDGGIVTEQQCTLGRWFTCPGTTDAGGCTPAGFCGLPGGGMIGCAGTGYGCCFQQSGSTSCTTRSACLGEGSCTNHGTTGSTVGCACEAFKGQFNIFANPWAVQGLCPSGGTCDTEMVQQVGSLCP